MAAAVLFCSWDGTEGSRGFGSAEAVSAPRLSRHGRRRGGPFGATRGGGLCARAPGDGQVHDGGTTAVAGVLLADRHFAAPGRVLERRRPMLLLRLPGLLLLRFATRALAAVLFQLPPRLTRLSPPPVGPPRGSHPGRVRSTAAGGDERAPQPHRVALLCPRDRGRRGPRRVLLVQPVPAYRRLRRPQPAHQPPATGAVEPNPPGPGEPSAPGPASRGHRPTAAFGGSPPNPRVGAGTRRRARAQLPAPGLRHRWPARLRTRPGRGAPVPGGWRPEADRGFKGSRVKESSSRGGSRSSSRGSPGGRRRDRRPARRRR